MLSLVLYVVFAGTRHGSQGVWGKAAILVDTIHMGKGGGGGGG